MRDLHRRSIKSLATVLLESLKEIVRVVWRVVVDNVWGIVRINLVDVLAKLAAGLSLDLLDLLEATRLDEGALSLELSGENLSELGADVSKNIVRGELQEGLKSGDMGAHLDNVLQSLLGLVLEVLA